MPTKAKSSVKKSHAEEAPTVDERPPVVRQVVEVVEEEVAPVESGDTEVTIDIKTTHPHDSLEENIKEELEHTPESPRDVVSPVPEDFETEPVTGIDAPRQSEESSTFQSVRSHKQTSPDEEQKPDVLSELFGDEEKVGFPDISMHTKKSSRLSIWTWVLLVLGVAIVVSGGLLLAFRAFSGSEDGSVVLPFAKASPTPTPEPTAVPTPTFAPVDKSAVRIEVLNGGGVPGAAGKMKTFLLDAGYQVSKTGNADEYTYEKTTIVVKDGQEALVQQLKEDLSSEYTVEVSAESLPDDAAVDAQVIVGKE